MDGEPGSRVLSILVSTLCNEYLTNVQTEKLGINVFYLGIGGRIIDTGSEKPNSRNVPIFLIFRINTYYVLCRIPTMWYFAVVHNYTEF